MNTGTLILIAALAYLAYKQSGGSLMPASSSTNGASNAPGAPAQTAITNLPTHDPVTGAPLTDEGQAAILAQTSTAGPPTVPVIDSAAAPVYTPQIAAGNWINAPSGAGSLITLQNQVQDTGAMPPDTWPAPSAAMLQAAYQWGSVEKVIQKAMESYYNAGEWAENYRLPMKVWSWYRRQVPNAKVPTPAEHGVNIDRMLTYNEYLDVLRQYNLLKIDSWGNLGAARPVRWH